MNDDVDDRVDRVLTEAGAAWRTAHPAPDPAATLLADRPHATHRPARATRRPAWRRGAVLAAAVAIAVLVVLAFALPHVVGRHTTTPLDATSDTFVAEQPVDGGPASSIGLFSRADGHLVTTLFTSDTGRLSAVRESATAVVVSHSVDCSATVLRVDVATGRTTTLWHADETVEDLAISPDGSRLAYLTDAPCTVPPPCTGVCNGPAGVVSEQPVVVDLLTGAHRQAYPTAADTAWSPPGWSPDGSQFVTTDRNSGQLDVYTVAHPDADAAVLPPPGGCSFQASAWSPAGVVAGLGCGADPGSGTTAAPSADSQFSPGSLALVDARGTVVRSWPVPDCVDGFTVRTDGSATLVQADVGYGDGACGRDWSIALSVLDGASLTPLFRVPRPFGGGDDLFLQSG